MKIIISAQIELDPANRADALQQAVPTIEEIKALPGCIRYDWAADCVDAGRIVVYEEWENAAALDAHFAGPGFAEMQGLLGRIGLTSAKALKFSVDREGSVLNADRVPSSSFD
ncbi:MAG: hypothetical protein Hens3KO_20700 [Henriciella sp.]